MERDKLAEAIERLRIMSKQKLLSEMDDEDQAGADFEGAYNHFCHEARAVYAALNEPPASYNPLVEGSTGVEVGEYTPAEIEFIQCLFDRYSENGGIIDLVQDHGAFMKIVRKYIALAIEGLIGKGESKDYDRFLAEGGF